MSPGATSTQLLNPSRGGYTNTVLGLDNPFSEEIFPNIQSKIATTDDGITA